MNQEITLCECCNTNPALPAHVCPFAEEIHGNTDACTCCGECEYQCAMDI